MPANVETMAYVGEKPWHGLGKPVPPTVHANEMIRAAGLDWEVEKRPARGASLVRKRLDRSELYARYELVRLPLRGDNEEEVVLGIVSDRYEPLQNREAFEFFNPIVDRKAAAFETAGSLGQGERIWVMARMPQLIQVVRGDDCQKYLLLSNTHTGQGAVVVKFTAVRVVCQNTLMLAINDGQRAFRVRHSRVMPNRLKQVADLIAMANEVYAKAAALFRRLAEIPLRRELMEKYLEAVFPKSEAQKTRGSQPEKWQHVAQLLDTAPDLQISGVQGTLWAAYNAITRFEDYRVVQDESGDGRLDRIWFGGGATVKLKALEAAARLAG